MRRRAARAAALVMITVLAGTLTGFVNPAWACGCGAMVANGDIRVDGESSIVRWDGSTEQIVLRLAVDSQAPDAAWIFPTPAVATVELGHRDWFPAIDDLTKPTVRVKRDWWPPWGGLGYGRAGAPTGGSVRVLGERQLGPFTVATLDATDAGALSGWLETNGYQLRADLARALDGYVKQRWKYVAVKLTPGTGATEAALDGELDPLHLSFASERLVYPMSMSRLARTPQYVHVWVVAPHRVQRVDPDTTRIPTPVRFAGPVSGVGGSLGDFIGTGQWLTEFDARISQPGEITTDWQFAYAATDTGYREVEVDVRPVYILGVPGGWFLVGLAGAGLALLLGTFAIVVARRRGISR